MELIVISSPVFLRGESEYINRLFAAGMSCFHLRKEGKDPAAFQQLLQGIDPEYHNRISLHQHHELATRFGIGRLHFPEALRPGAKEALALKKAGYTLSTSIHKLDHITDLENYNYSFYGPVFDSISKKGYHTGIPESFKMPLDFPTRLIAIGGIDATKTAQVKAMGFTGLAILGTLWENTESAVGNFKIIQEQCQQTDHM